MESKFCKFCNCEHPLTEEWWYRVRHHSYKCKIYMKERSKKDYYSKVRPKMLKESPELDQSFKDKKLPTDKLCFDIKF